VTKPIVARLLGMRFILGVLFVACSSLSYGQGLTSEGREFYLGHIHPSHTDVLTGPAAGQVRAYAIVSSYTDNEVYVSYFDPTTGKEGDAKRYSVAALRSIEVLLDQIVMRPSEPGDIAEYRSCHIKSKDPVAIHYYISGACATGGYLALPVGTWGKEYVVATEQDNPGVGAWVNPPSIVSADNSNGCFMIIAAENETKITIWPNARTGGGHVGATQGQGAAGTPQPYQIMLQRGQSYFVRSISAFNGDYDDMSGSIVKADKPIAVIMAHENANVGDGLVRETNQTDARDFMIEQAIPWEYATYTGNVTLPMEDSQGLLEGGQGEDVKIFVAETDPARAVRVHSNEGLVASYNTAPFSLPPVTRSSVTAPLHYSCDSGKRMQVIEYELRSDGGGTPFTTPAMMNIIPFKCWRNAYLWYVPKKLAVLGQTPYEEYYVTVIAYGPVAISVDAGPTENISQALKSVKGWYFIPQLPPLPWNSYTHISAKTYKFGPGTTYYVRSQYPFMVYVHGYVGTDNPPNRPTYSGFAYPVGMRGKAEGKERIGLNAEGACKSWMICAVDSNGIPIKDLILYNDPKGNFLGDIDAKYQYSSFNFKVDELIAGTDKSCIKVSVIDTSINGVASIIATDAAGNLKTVTLWYSPESLRATSDFKGFDSTRIGDTAVGSFTLRTPNSFDIKKIEISDPDVVSVQIPEPLPIYLRAYNSLQVKITFTPKDTVRTTATVRFSNECWDFAETFTIKGATGLIEAEDNDFGNVAKDTKECADIQIENKGSIAYRLLPTFSIAGSAEFAVDKSKLPLLVQAGQLVSVKVCYSPKDESADTAVIYWATDISEPYTNSIKSTSILYGNALKNAVAKAAREPQISIWPNPSSGKCTLDLRSLAEKKVAISIYNALGVECYSTETVGGSTVEIQMPQATPGNYTVRASSDEQIYTLRFILQ
jgi:hypothetical protein